MNTEHQDFNHSRYFNFHDQGTDITGFMRIGMKPNREQKSLFFFLMIGQDAVGIKGDAPMDGDDFRCMGMEFVPLGNEHWQIIYRGPLYDRQGKSKDVSLDLIWTPLHEEFDYRRCAGDAEAEISASVASEHYEQFGSLRGTLEINGNRIEINGLGERDRSIGVRDWGSPLNWLWINAQFSESEAFNLTQLVMGNGKVDCGFMHYGEVSRPLRSVRADIKQDGARNPVSFRLHLEDQEGWVYEVEGKVRKKAEMPFEGADGTRAVIVETLAEYRWAGRHGYGIAEFMYRL